MSSQSSHEPQWLRRLTAALLIVVPIAFSLCFTFLQSTFSYPAILDAAPEDILTKFAAGGTQLLITWYAYMICALLLIPLVLLLHQVIAARASVPWLGLATGLGVLAGLVQGMGLARWVFLTPYLARTYQDPASSVNVKQAVAIVFQSFNQYAGAGLGEHFGYLFTAAWTILISFALIQARIAPRWLGLAGAVIGVGILAGDLKVAGLGAAAQINSIAYIAWALWLIALGALLWIREPAPLSAPIPLSVA